MEDVIITDKIKEKVREERMLVIVNHQSQIRALMKEIQKLQARIDHLKSKMSHCTCGHLQMMYNSYSSCE